LNLAPKAYILIVLVFASLAQGCTGVKHLQDGELLLRRQKIKGNREVSNEALEAFYRQKPNKRFPLVPVAPYVMVYYLGKSRYRPEKIEKRKTKALAKFDKKIAKAEAKDRSTTILESKKRSKIEKLNKAMEEGNMLMRWGEPVAVFDENITAQTRTQMELYLNTQGFFDARVEAEIRRSQPNASVVYRIREGQPLIIDSVELISKDTAVYDIIFQNRQKSLLKPGMRYKQDAFAKERERIDLLLKDEGYYDFSRQLVIFEIDTLAGDKKANIKTIISLPQRQQAHRVFTLDSVNFVTDAGLANPPVGQRNTELYRGVVFQYYEDEYSKRVLNYRVFLKPGQKYSLKNTLETQRQLANLDNFKFINVNYDTTDGRFIANIFTSSLNKYQTTNEIGMNVREGFPGPFYNLALKSRNVFGGLENIDMNLFFGFEGVGAASKATDVYRSIESGGRLTLTFPQFVMPSTAAFRQRIGRYDPKTRLLLGYNYTRRPEFERSNFNASLIYGWNRTQKVLYNFTLSEISLINSNIITQEFRDFLQAEFNRGNNLLLVFNPSFITAMGFQTTINFRTPTDTDRRASILRLNAETGGTIFNFFRPIPLEERNLEYYKYVKFNADYRRHIQLGVNSVLASRINIGVGLPYGENGLLPYEKSFFAGGSSSVRAWRPRRLGLGSFNADLFEGEGEWDPERLDNINKPEQPGDILLEASIEYRDKLVGFVDWAFFVDAGNVWKANQIYGAGEDFDLRRFYREIALGSGLGLRLNFSFLIIRFDAGVKLWDPERPEGDRFVGRFVNWNRLLGKPGQTIWNIAIGYPF
jgi:outer membrane protein insertion porin family